MKSVFSKLIIAGLLLLFISSPSAADQSRGFKIGKIKELSHKSGKLGAYKALVIGINDYKDPKITDLKTAVNDAKEMGSLLKTKYGFSIDLLLDHQATKAAIVKKLRKLAASANPNESILIYYAGHGDLDRVLNGGWWIPWDARGGEPTTYLDNTLVQKVLSAIKARHVLLVSDSCYSGALFGQVRSLPQVIDDRFYLSLYNEKSRWGMTSGNKTPVSDAGSEGHSVFAYQLLKALRKNEKPYITTQEVYTQIASIISNNSEQMPRCQPIRNTGDQGGGFVFVAALKEESKAVTSPAPTVPKPQQITPQMELTFWQSIQNSKDPAEYKAYLAEFPDGKFAGLAKIKIRKLTPKKVVAPISADDLGRGVLNALKVKDVEKFLRFYPTKDDWQGLVSLIPPETPPKEKESVKKHTEKAIARRDVSIQKFRGSFDEVYERGTKEGVNWETAKYVSIEYKPRVEMVEIADIEFLFSSNNTKYRIKLDDCLNFKRGWLIRDRIFWAGADLPKAAAKPKLFVETNPHNARVRILNIKPKFYQGIELDNGHYHVEVSADGYESQRVWVSMSAGKDMTIDIRLKHIAVVTPVQAAGRKVRNNLGMEFIYIKPGTFMMGSPSHEKGRYNNEKQHQVTLTRGFYMQTTEVTQGQWKAVMGSNPSRFKGDDLPVEQISWNDVQEFIRRLNQREGGDKYRLPTEAEWEYACRAGRTTRFSFGDDESRLGEYAWYDGNSGSRTHPVAQKKPNAWGLYDMHGNVWEWCQDRYGDYPSGSVTDPEGPSSGSYRVIRGGSWVNEPRFVRSANRGRSYPDYRNYNLGFRLLRRTGSSP